RVEPRRPQPRPADARSLEERRERGPVRIEVCRVNVLPPPTHRGAGGAREGPAPEGLVQRPEMRVGSRLPPAPIGPILADEEGLAVFVEELPGQEVGKGRPARRDVAQAFLIELAGLR